MNTDKLKPTNITDIIFRIDEYLDCMRAQRQNAHELLDFLEKYIKGYFRTLVIDKIELKTLTVKLVDEMYIKICQFVTTDIHTNAYFGILVNRLFFELANKNILCFFVIDNLLRDDRFKLISELFDVSNFKTVFPYAIKQLDYNVGYTKFPSKEYKTIEKEIVELIDQKKHILYLEKDDSCNYLNNVLSLVEEFQNEYLCVFRNQSPDSNKPAIWLLGSFSDILK